MSDNPKKTNVTDDIAAGEKTNNNGGGNGVANAMIGLVRPTDIIQEVQVAYLDYAMSVIVARALPDVRDGLKPVHRRILYAMWHDLSLTHDKPHKKSARIVGEVLGKYHPHGDSAVYDAMVRMAQPFSLRYTLVDGQGNFGSVDGDNAAAMRYTEARLAEISDLMLEDLEKDTVGWHPNFDNTLREPDILPAALPNLLINGSSGIAVGMATNIPPHNLGEVVDALTYAIDHYHAFEDVTIEQLMQFIKGPDFPTGGIVYRYREEAGDEGQIDVIAQGYSVGKSRLVLQAKAHFEEMTRGRMRIVVTELPYQTNKTTLIERIADLVRDGKIEGISDLRDESDRTGMRVLIELTRGVDPKAVLKDLYKYTPLQQTFGMQMLALVDGQPRLLTLKRMLQLFIQHREEIIRRRSEFDLARARERAHIVEGLLRALDILDEVIQTIRKSQTVETARKNLVANFKFSEVQAQAILDMQLRRLAALERKKLQEEHDELRRRIAYLEDLLKHPDKILALIKADLLEIKAKYGDARRTQIVDRTKGALTTTDLLPDHQVWVAVSKEGDLRRQDATRITPAALRQAARDGDLALLSASARDFLYLFTQDGRCARISVHEIPAEGGAKNTADLTGFTRRDKLGAALALPREPVGDAPGFIFFTTLQGQVKRVTVADLTGQVQGDFPVMKVEDKDRLGWALLTKGEQDVVLVTSSGQAIRFAEEEVRSMGLPAGGVGGIRTGKGETVVAAGVVDPEGALLTLTAHGFAKQSPLADYPRQGRNGGGVVTHKTAARTGPVAAAMVVPASGAPPSLAVIMTKAAPRLLAPEEVPLMGRGVLGKQVVAAGDGTLVAGLRWLGIPGTGGPGSADPPTPPPAAPQREQPPEARRDAQPRAAVTDAGQTAAPAKAGPAPKGKADAAGAPAPKAATAIPSDKAAVSAVKSGPKAAEQTQPAPAQPALSKPEPLAQKGKAVTVGGPPATQATAKPTGKSDRPAPAAVEPVKPTAKATKAGKTPAAETTAQEPAEHPPLATKVPAGAKPKAVQAPPAAKERKPVAPKAETPKAAAPKAAASKPVVSKPPAVPSSQPALFAVEADDEQAAKPSKRAAKLQTVTSVKKRA